MVDPSAAENSTICSRGAAGAKRKTAKRRHAKRRHARRASARASAVTPDPLQATTFKYLEPQAGGRWVPIALDRSKQLSFYYCSGWSYDGNVNLDPAGVGGCPN